MDSLLPPRRGIVGAVLAVALLIALASVMFPLRGHLSIATTALVLIVPVVVAVAAGGFGSGIMVTLLGFFVYDFVFIPPYYTLYVGAAQNWVALGVYVVVMTVFARVVATLDAARADAQRRSGELRRLFDLSELLVRESPLQEVAGTIVSTVREAFSLDGAALLMVVGDGLDVVASSGEPLSGAERRQMSTGNDTPVGLGTQAAGGSLRAMALTASGKGIGLLALRAMPGAEPDRDLLQAFANHLALALERAQLHEEAVKGQALAETDRLRSSLIGAVSHDLRTPLATIRVSASTLLDPGATLGTADTHELLSLIDAQATRLDRFVSNLLDMTRIRSGTLELRREPAAIADLVQEALAALGPSADLRRVTWRAVSGLPPVHVDHVLVRQVLANLIDNATRHAPGTSPIVVSASRLGSAGVEVSVADHGPGVPASERGTVFQMFNRREAGGRGGLGLAIAHAFVEAHGEQIWVEDNSGGGARFCFTLPASGHERAA